MNKSFQDQGKTTREKTNVIAFPLILSFGLSEKKIISDVAN
jgi:hypothetical protein